MAERKSHPRVSTSTGSWPTAWHASSRYGTPASRATAPTAAAGFTRPPWVGIHEIAIRRTRSSSIVRRASTESWPASSSGITSTCTPVFRATWRRPMTLLAYSARDVRMRSPGEKRRGQRVERHVPRAGRVLHERDLSRRRPDQRRHRLVHRAGTRRDRIGGRVPADACFQLEVFDHRVDDHARWERSARVVEMHHVAAPGRVGPDSCDVDQQAPVQPDLVTMPGRGAWRASRPSRRCSSGPGSSCTPSPTRAMRTRRCRSRRGSRRSSPRTPWRSCRGPW